MELGDFHGDYVLVDLDDIFYHCDVLICYVCHDVSENGDVEVVVVVAGEEVEMVFVVISDSVYVLVLVILIFSLVVILMIVASVRMMSGL